MPDALLDIDRGTMNYRVDGPPDAAWAIILPGAFTAPWQYEPARDHLARSFRVVTLDYRGVGGTRNDLWHVTPAVLARDVLRLLDALDVAHAHAACISLGTFVLAELLHIAPERIGRCAVGAMPALRHRGPVIGDRAHEAVDLARAEDSAHQIVIRALTPTFWSDAFRETEPERYREAMARMLDMTVRDVWTGVQQFQGIFGYDWERTTVYARLPPTRRLFLTGDADPFAPIDDVRDHPLYRVGPTVVFGGSGHLFLYEQASRYNAVVEHFFATGRPPDPLPGAGELTPLEIAA
jgi:pimeloyl-ACP methyl ester carboxylesterase